MSKEKSFWDWLFNSSCCGDRGKGREYKNEEKDEEIAADSKDWLSIPSCGSRGKKNEYHGNPEDEIGTGYYSYISSLEDEIENSHNSLKLLGAKEREDLEEVEIR